MKITKVEIEFDNGFCVYVTLEEAKELRDKLNKLFGGEKEYIPYPTYPFWRDYTDYTIRYFPWHDTHTTCKGGD